MRGRVIAIHVAAAAGDPMQARSAARAVPGRGLEGDRYFAGAGAFSVHTRRGGEVTEVTLIEDEVIEHLQHDLCLGVSAADTRRNIVTRLVALNELVGVEFSIGSVRLRGTGLCEPCVSLVKSPQNRHLLRGLVHKGGLRARILTEGVMTIGDDVRTHAEARLAVAG